MLVTRLVKFIEQSMPRYPITF